MVNEKVDTRGLTCPRPLIETKKKLKKMKVGETLEVTGDHAPSKREVPDMMEGQGHQVLSVKEQNGVWKVIIRKK